MPGPAQSSTSLVNKIDGKYAAATTRANYSAFQSSIYPRLSLHISQSSCQRPAQDGPCGAPTAGIPQSQSADEALFDSPSRRPLTSGRGGVWESVVGSVVDRPSTDGPRDAIEVLMGATRLPKRKSLSNLFGLGPRKSMDKMKTGSPTRAYPSASCIAGQLVLKSLTEEAEEPAEAPRPIPISAASDVFTSRLPSLTQLPKQEKEVIRKGKLYMF